MMASDKKQTDAYWDAAFTFGKFTCDKCQALLSASREDDYSELATRARGLGWLVTDGDAGGFEIRCPACSQLGWQGRAAVQVVNVPLHSQPEMGSFDLGRLTVVGVLTSLLALAVCIALTIAVCFACLGMFPAIGKNALKIAGVAGGVVGIGFFFAAQALLQALGVSVVRPQPKSVSDRIVALNRRLSQAKAWRMFFLVSAAVGLLLTCGVSWVLANALGPAGFTHFEVLGIGAIVLPMLVTGGLLMHSDVCKHAQALAAAKAAGH